MDSLNIEAIPGLPTAVLEAEVRNFAASIAAATCRWLLMIGELDRREAWWESGSPSCAHWLSWQCGVSLPTGREQLRVAHCLTDLPVTTAAFAAGELSYAKVRALTRVATAECEAELVELARTATAAQLELIVRAFRRCATTGLDDARARHARRFTRLRVDDDGSLIVTGRIPPEAAPIVRMAFDQAVESLRSGLPADALADTSREQLQADAFVAVCDAALAHELDGRTGTDRYMVNVTVDAQTVTGDNPDGVCHIQEGGAIAQATVRRLLCDAATMPVIEAADGRPVAAGRTQRTCSRRQRRALLARNGHCRFPSCTHTKYVDVHHVQHWADGGPTVLPNLIPICWYHHRLLHEEGFTLEIVAGEPMFRRPDGARVSAEAPRFRSTCDLVATSRIPGDTIRARGNSERFDLGLTIDAMFGLVGVSAETSGYHAPSTSEWRNRQTR